MFWRHGAKLAVMHIGVKMWSHIVEWGSFEDMWCHTGLLVNVHSMPTPKSSIWMKMWFELAGRQSFWIFLRLWQIIPFAIVYLGGSRTPVTQTLATQAFATMALCQPGAWPPKHLPPGHFATWTLDTRALCPLGTCLPNTRARCHPDTAIQALCHQSTCHLGMRHGDSLLVTFHSDTEQSFLVAKCPSGCVQMAMCLGDKCLNCKRLGGKCLGDNSSGGKCPGGCV